MQVKITKAMQSGNGTERYRANQVVIVPDAIGETLIARGSASPVTDAPAPNPAAVVPAVTLSAAQVQAIEATVEQAVESALKGA